MPLSAAVSPPVGKTLELARSSASSFSYERCAAGSLPLSSVESTMGIVRSRPW